MVGRPSGADLGGDVLRFRYGRNDGDIGKQRQAAQGAVHVQRLQLSRRDHEYQLPLRPFQDRGNRDRPHRRETGAAGDKHNAAGMISPEKGAAIRSRYLDAMPDADISAELRGYNTVGEPPDVEIQQAIVSAPFQRIGRAVGSRRKSAILHLAKLTGKIMKRFRQLDGYAENIGSQTNDVGDLTGHRDLVRNGFGHDLDVGDNSRLAGVDHVVALLVAAKDPALNEAHAAGAANPGAAVMRQVNTTGQRPVEQQG